MILDKMKTERLSIRRFHLLDLQDLFEMTSNEQVVKSTGLRSPLDLNTTKIRLESWCHDPEVWAIEYCVEFKVVGWIMLKKTTCDDPELGYMLAQSYWGMGIASEACRALLSFARESSFKRVIAKTDRTNHASINVLKKLGMSENSDSNNESEGLLFELFI
ncbi:GNAT family N-acetyltransferase [Halobacteriovorax sp. GB3]|uniref:GNAT family N-acetyltransferase n=1 Tax=Halobacteriovorax sp. GB3 TaxID=2719615 RepID=UPI00235E42CE|nr:GNAT family N-acetyltransferase [Halobacteriovorax sp. GB3]MDD0853620.1 GNAT family N-acetyltransferase [Halobacteriovorax sp. GB3]